MKRGTGNIKWHKFFGKEHTHTQRSHCTNWKLNSVVWYSSCWIWRRNQFFPVCLCALIQALNGCQCTIMPSHLERARFRASNSYTNDAHIWLPTHWMREVREWKSRKCEIFSAFLTMKHNRKTNESSINFLNQFKFYIYPECGVVRVRIVCTLIVIYDFI